jgi:hypothetical protein
MYLLIGYDGLRMWRFGGDLLEIFLRFFRFVSFGRNLVILFEVIYF